MALGGSNKVFGRPWLLNGKGEHLASRQGPVESPSRELRGQDQGGEAPDGLSESSPQNVMKESQSFAFGMQGYTLGNDNTLSK